jgi:hypothetical protein
MRILFSALTPTFLKNFESVVSLLSARGHEVQLLFRSADEAATEQLVPSLVALPGVSLVQAAEAESNPRRPRWVSGIRSSLDYLRFVEPRFASPAYRTRAKDVPPLVRRAAQFGPLRTTDGRRLLRRGLLAADRLARPDPGLVRLLERQRPDAVLVTPYLIRWDTTQAELVRAARSLRLPTAVCVGSWDHLSTKASICPHPDALFVWNEIQRREAREFHGVSPRRVVVTGAQCFDHWFVRTPGPRAEFCSSVGLDPDRRYILYTCSAELKRRSPPERAFVLRWLEAVRADEDPGIASAGVLIRPHPRRTEIWDGIDLRDENAVVFPRDPVFPTTEAAKRTYFDSIYHSAAVVGLNTSAMLEAGLIGRPVLTVLTRELEASQAALVHFRYLLDAGGGLVQATDRLDEHMRLLRRTIADDNGDYRARNAPFIQEFLRPHGLDREATPIFVDAVERLGRR